MEIWANICTAMRNLKRRRLGALQFPAKSLLARKIGACLTVTRVRTVAQCLAPNFTGQRFTWTQPTWTWVCRMAVRRHARLWNTGRHHSYQPFPAKRYHMAFSRQIKFLNFSSWFFIFLRQKNSFKLVQNVLKYLLLVGVGQIFNCMFGKLLISFRGEICMYQK